MQALGPVHCFDVLVREGQIVLTPVRMQRGDGLRWLRQTREAPDVAEPDAKYRTRPERGPERQVKEGKARRK